MWVLVRTASPSLNEKIQESGSSNSVQEEVNLLYSDFCGVLRNEMLQKLPHRHIILKFGLNNERRRYRKPWWNDSLAENGIKFAQQKATGVKQKTKIEMNSKIFSFGCVNILIEKYNVQKGDIGFSYKMKWSAV